MFALSRSARSSVALFSRSTKTSFQKASYFNYGNVGIQVLRMKDNPDYHHDPGHDSEVWKASELVGPGIKKTEMDVVPTQFDQATGKERIELMALLDGKDPYCGLMTPLDGSRKGTKANPIEVLSPDEDRMVGCRGHPGRHHAVQWMNVTEDGHKYWEYGHNRCAECGNTFKLKRINIPYPTIN